LLRPHFCTRKHMGWVEVKNARNICRGAGFLAKIPKSKRSTRKKKRCVRKSCSTAILFIKFSPHTIQSAKTCLYHPLAACVFACQICTILTQHPLVACIFSWQICKNLNKQHRWLVDALLQGNKKRKIYGYYWKQKRRGQHYIVL
jgi:hypothetical protein